MYSTGAGHAPGQPQSERERQSESEREKEHRDIRMKDTLRFKLISKQV